MVTGGSQGLGEAICRRLAKDGYMVTVADINTEAGETLANEIDNCQFVRVDVTEPSQMESAVRRVVEDHGTLDALVNNAGVLGSQVPIGDCDVEEWKRTLDINLNGTFYGLKYGLSQMIKQDTGGNVVNMSSPAGFRGIRNLGAYTASKFAIRGMTASAAVEYANRKIRVNAIAPTGCETPLVQEYIETSPNPDFTLENVTAMNAIPAMPKGSDVAAACAFLLSDEARFVTGHTLPVDAGSLSRMANSLENWD